MNLTNIYNLPLPILRAISYQRHHRDHIYSVTELINPPRIVQLSRRHDSEIEEDVSERIWALLGSAVHYILEKGVGPNELAEESLECEVEGTRILAKGHPDLLAEKKLTDYKITSVWSYLFQPQGKPEWIAQQNTYKWLWAQYGFELDTLEVCAILRDWVKSRRNEPGYPPVPIVTIKLPIWSDPLPFIKERILLHEKAKGQDDDALPECTLEERWQNPDRFALMKKGQKRAIKVFDDKESCNKALTTLMVTDIKNHYYIEERIGRPIRCLEYCNVWRWCKFGQEAHNHVT